MDSSGHRPVVPTLLFFLVSFVCAAPGWGDRLGSAAGVISGTVSDSQDGRPICGVALSLVPAGVRGSSDLEGRFVFEEVPPGTYTLSAKRRGYWSARLPDVAVGEQGRLCLSVSLEPRAYVLDEIVVSASRIEEPRGKVPEPSVVVGGSDLSAQVAADLGEALLGIPGLIVERNLGVGSITYPSIRGSDRSRVLATLDGIPLNCLFEGAADLSWVPVEHLERIEVQKGASSPMWGSSQAGAVHLTTRVPDRPGRPTATPTLWLGEWGTRRGNLSIEGGWNTVNYILSGHLLHTEGFREKTEADRKSVLAKIKASSESGQVITLMVAHSQGEEEGGTFPDYGIWNSYDRRTSCAAANLSFTAFSAVDVALGVNAIRQGFKVFTYPLGSEDPMRIAEIKEQNLGFSTQGAWHPHEGFRWIAGLDARQSFLDTEGLGGRRDVTEKALFTTADLFAGSAAWSVGLRLDHNSQFGSELSPSLGVVYEWSRLRTVLRGTVSQDFHSPLLPDKYFEDPLRGLVPNPDIEPERSWVYQVGLESQPLAFLLSRVALYRLDTRNAISYLVDPASGEVMAKNIAHRRRQGAEIELKATFRNGVWYSAAATLNDVRELEPNTSFWTLSPGEVMEDRPRVVYDLGMGYQGDAGPQVSLRGSYIWWNAPQHYLADDRKFLWDAAASRKLHGLAFGTPTVLVSVRNIFDSPYCETAIYPRPGRRFEAGLSWIL